MLRLFGFAPAEAPCKENAAAKKTRTVVDVEEPARKSLAELDAERHADCQRMSQLWALHPMLEQPKHRQTAQNIWTLSIYIRVHSPDLSQAGRRARAGLGTTQQARHHTCEGAYAQV